MSFTCVNCGKQNTLGDCCPECAARDCHRCDTLIPMDEENTPNIVFPDDWGKHEFYDGAYNVCDECLTKQETKLKAIFHGDGITYVRKDGATHFHADSTNTILVDSKKPKERES